jgi:predicted O-methyltransferase YrrM
LWSGRVVEENPDATTRAIQEFNRELYQSKDFYTTIMPVRDGVAVAVRV